jgi:hypothetical protein
VTDQNPIRTARRKALREQRLGPHAFCLFCGYTCLEALTRVSVEWLEARGINAERLHRLHEAHHIFGQALDPGSTVTLCLNCHREITEGLAREGVSMRAEANQHKLIALSLRASAVLFESLAKSFRKWASWLEEAWVNE